MVNSIFFWGAQRREWILRRVVLETGDNTVELMYSVLADFDQTDSADFVSEHIKDNVWASIPGEHSA